MAVTRRDLFFVPLCEGVLILIVALAGWVTHRPFIFASLGPTAFELTETPNRASARPYNILAGHLLAVLAGFAALWITNARNAPAASAIGLPLVRVWAAVLSTVLTVFVTLLLRATQPAALATTLLVSLGIMQRIEDGFLIMAGVALMTLVGEPIRRWQSKLKKEI